MTNKGLKQAFGFCCCSYPLHWHFRFVCWDGIPSTSMTLPKSTCASTVRVSEPSIAVLLDMLPLSHCAFGLSMPGYIYRQDIAVIDHCTTTKAHTAQAGLACLHLSSKEVSMASTRRWSRFFALSALVCLLVVQSAAMVNGLRREQLVLGPDTAPVPAVAPTAGGRGGANAVGVGTTRKQFAAATATTVGAVQMSKWRVRRGSDPIHNRS